MAVSERKLFAHITESFIIIYHKNQLLYFLLTSAIVRDVCPEVDDVTMNHTYEHRYNMSDSLDLRKELCIK